MRQKTRNIETVGLSTSATTVAAAFTGALLASEPANAQTRVRGFVGLFNHGQDVEFGAELSRRFDLGQNWNIDTSFSVMSDGRSVRLGNAELDINTPRFGPVSFSVYVYNSAFLNVDLGVGGMATIWNRLNISAEWERPNWEGVFVNYVLRLGSSGFGSRISITPQAIFLFSEHGAEGAGGWLRLDVDCGFGVNVRAQVNHVRSLRTSEPINENAMIAVSFGF